MKIGLYNLEPKIVNTAMMQVSKYHKDQGDQVEKYNPLFHESYDKVYAFSIFDFTKKTYVRKDMICGGTGFDMKTKLPKEIEDCDYDWSLYPKCDFSIVWFSRGCRFNHPYCVVPKKEGKIKEVKVKNLNPNATHIKVYDNDFFGNQNWKEAINFLIDLNQPVDFSSGINIRTLTTEQCKYLQKIKVHKYIHIAWDDPRENLIPKIEKFIKYIKPYKIHCYVLIGYWSTPEEDMMRVKTLWEDYRIAPYVMPFNKKDHYQKHFARWVNHKAVFKTVKWEDYSRK